MADHYKLDNPVWYALSEVQKDYALHFGSMKFYQPDYCPFGSVEHGENAKDDIAAYGAMCSNFFIVGSKPAVPVNIILNAELVCLQMIREQKIIHLPTHEVVELDRSNLHDVLELVGIAYPHYFKNKTFNMGTYNGIYVNNQLAAITGERMKLNDYTEVSAVITHPAHVGKGYAGQLVAHTVNHIIAQHKLPFLHVAETNNGAIHLYKKLGFVTRRKISFWNLRSPV